MPKKDDRYAANWQSIAAAAHRATNGKCCWCCTADSTEVHHVRYWRDGVPVKGCEIPGKDVFPLCGECHLLLHSGELWASVPDKFARKNTPTAIQNLEENFTKLESTNGPGNNDRRSAANNPRTA